MAAVAVAEVAVVDLEVVAVPAASYRDGFHSSWAVVVLAASGAAAVADDVVAAVAAVDYNAIAAVGAGHTAYHPVPLATNHSSLVPILWKRVAASFEKGTIVRLVE